MKVMDTYLHFGEKLLTNRIYNEKGSALDTTIYVHCLS